MPTVTARTTRRTITNIILARNRTAKYKEIQGTIIQKIRYGNKT